MLIDGIHVPLTAPFYRDGKSYLRKLEHNVARYSLTPAAGLVALPPAGEGLSDAETLEALQSIAAFAAKEKVLVLGVTKNTVHEALALCAQAFDNSFDAILLAAPPQWPEMQRRAHAEEVLAFFRTVADRSPLPVLLHSDAAAPSLALSVPVIAALATHENIVGLYCADLTVKRYKEIAAATAMKQREVTVTPTFRPVTRRMLHVEATGPATFVSAEILSSAGTSTAVAPPQPALKTRTRKVGFQVMSAGSAATMVELLEAGVAGAMPQLAACAPQATHEALAAHQDGDPKLAAEKSARLVEASALVEELGIAAVKYACDLNGYFGGFPRLPRLPLDGPSRERVDKAFRELRN